MPILSTVLAASEGLIGDDPTQQNVGLKHVEELSYRFVQRQQQSTSRSAAVKQSDGSQAEGYRERWPSYRCGTRVLQHYSVIAGSHAG